MNIVRTIVVVHLAVSVAGLALGDEGDVSALAEQLSRDFKTRHQHFESAQYQLAVDTEWGASSFAIDEPPEPVKLSATSQWTFDFHHHWFRKDATDFTWSKDDGKFMPLVVSRAFDGKLETSFTPAAKNPWLDSENAQHIIEYHEYATGNLGRFSAFSELPLLFAHGFLFVGDPLPVDSIPAIAPESLRISTVAPGNSRMVSVTVSRGSKPICEYLIDLDRNSSVTRFDFFLGGGATLDIKHALTNDQWIPTSWTYVERNRNGDVTSKSKFAVKSFKPNPAVDYDHFRIVPEPFSLVSKGRGQIELVNEDFSRSIVRERKR